MVEFGYYPRSWVDANGIDRLSPFHQYVVSCKVTVHMFYPVSPHLPVYNDVEQVASSVARISGLVASVVTLALLLAANTTSDVSRNKYDTILKEVAQFAALKQFPESLRNR